MTKNNSAKQKPVKSVLITRPKTVAIVNKYRKAKGITSAVNAAELLIEAGLNLAEAMECSKPEK